MSQLNYKPFTIEEVFAVPNIDSYTLTLPPAKLKNNATSFLSLPEKISSTAKPLANKKYYYYLITAALALAIGFTYYTIKKQKKNTKFK